MTVDNSEISQVFTLIIALSMMWFYCYSRLIRTQVHNIELLIWQTYFFLLFKSGKRNRNSSPSPGTKKHHVIYCFAPRQNSHYLSCYSQKSPGPYGHLAEHHRDPSYGWLPVDQTEWARVGSACWRPWENTCIPEGGRQTLWTLRALPFPNDFRGPGAKDMWGHLPPSKLLQLASIYPPLQRKRNA